MSAEGAAAALVVLAGPNGAGKSTRASTLPAAFGGGQHVIVFNPDVATRAGEPCSATPSAAATVAAMNATESEIVRWINGPESGPRAAIVETVFSTAKYLPHLLLARSRGVRLSLVYVGLASPELAAARVALRVADGGHDVPTERIAGRFYRSLDNLVAYAPVFHEVEIWDNSDSVRAGTRAGRLLGQWDRDDPGRNILAPPPRRLRHDLHRAAARLASMFGREKPIWRGP